MTMYRPNYIETRGSELAKEIEAYACVHDRVELTHQVYQKTCIEIVEREVEKTRERKKIVRVMAP
jgi:hypothetical protein